MQDSSLAQAIAKTCLPPEIWIMIFQKLDLSSAVAAMQVLSDTFPALPSLLQACFMAAISSKVCMALTEDISGLLHCVLTKPFEKRRPPWMQKMMAIKGIDHPAGLQKLPADHHLKQRLLGQAYRAAHDC